MSISNHVWGQSFEQDVIWSNVVGLDSDFADRRLIMIWQGYFDETEKDGWFVLAGYLASAEKWAAFVPEWKRLARRYGRIDANGRRHFHMAEQAGNAEAGEFLPQMREIICDTALLGIGLAIRPEEFRSATKRVVALKPGQIITLSGSLIRNYYLYVFETFLDVISDLVKRSRPPVDVIDFKKERIDLFFDDRSEESAISLAWEDFKKVNKDRNILTSRPRFEDDKDFLPLQAADFFAYWLRVKIHSLGHANFAPEGNLFSFDYKSNKSIPYYIIPHDEEGIVKRLLSLEHNDPGMRLVDRKSFVTTRVTEW